MKRRRILALNQRQQQVEHTPMFVIPLFHMDQVSQDKMELHISQMNGSISVSYTHLDVYKRQIPFGRYFIDVPIEAEDPRFHIEYTSEDQATRFNYHGGYWKFVVPMSEEYSYDTIVQADESLKTNETVIDEGAFGTKSANVIGQFTNINTITSPEPSVVYSTNNADVIYNNIVTDFNLSLIHISTEPVVNDMLSKPWGDATVTDFTSSPATNRVLRVGIDYTHFVTEDGTSCLLYTSRCV